MIKSIPGTKKVFKILTKRILIGQSTKNKSGKSYTYVQDVRATLLLYKQIIHSIPAQPGIIILTGQFNKSQVTLEVVKCNVSIQSAFAKPTNKNRYQTLISYMEGKKFAHLEIQLAQAI